MKINKLHIILGVCILAFAGVLFYSRPQGTKLLGGFETTHRYRSASSTLITLVAGTSYRALASTTNSSVYTPPIQRDNLLFQYVGNLSTSVYCNMENDNVASLTNWSFALSSSTPTYVMNSGTGVQQGAIHCISTNATTFVVTEFNY